MGINTLGQVSAATDIPHEMLDWVTRTTEYLKGTADLAGGSGAAGPQLFLGSTNTFLGGTAEFLVPGVTSPALKVSRTTPANSPITHLGITMLVADYIPSSAASLEWLQLNRMDTYAATGEAVALYNQIYNRGGADVWGMVIEVQDVTGKPNTVQYGIELDLLNNNVSGVLPDGTTYKKGISINYGDALPNTMNPVGAVTNSGNAIEIVPFAGARNHMRNGFYAKGTFDEAVLNLDHLTATPIAMSIAGGSHLRFSSNTAGYSRSYWFPGTSYVPHWVGALEIIIDFAFFYIPIANNHP